MRMLAGFYDKSEEELAAMLEEEKDLEICYFCSLGVCKDMEGVRILFMLRAGKREEALERLEINLAKQPYDEFMLALKKKLEMEK